MSKYDLVECSGGCHMQDSNGLIGISKPTVRPLSPTSRLPIPNRHITGPNPHRCPTRPRP